MTALDALAWGQTILVMGIVLSSLEYLALKRWFGAGKIFRAMAPSGTGVNSFYALALVMATRALAAGLLCFTPMDHMLRSGILLFLVVMTLWLFHRIPFGQEGGDQLTLMALVLLFIQSLDSQNLMVAQACCLFWSGQLVLAYLKTGWIKFAYSGWRDGTLLQLLGSSELYGHPFLHKMVQTQKGQKGARAVLLFIEWGLPLSLLLPPSVFYVFFTLALLFHFANAVFLGLGGFFWAMAAVFPSLIVTHGLIQRVLQSH